MLLLYHKSRNLPSFNVNIDVKNISSNLRLADLNLFDSRPIDILLGADLYPKILLGGMHQNILGSLLAQNTVFGWILTGPLLPSHVHVHSAYVNFKKPNIVYSNSISIFSSTPSTSRLITNSDKQLRLDPTILKPHNNLTNRFRNNKSSFQQIDSVKKPRKNINLNDFVILKNDRLPPTLWSIGQIVKVHTGRLKFDIKTKNRIVQLNTNQLIKLNI